RKWDRDYAARGWYFITICTQQMRPHFGHVSMERMNLSLLGIWADKCWKQIPEHHKDIAIDEFIVMPNHIHGIIVIDGPEQEPRLIPGVKRPLEGPKAGALGAVVRSYKSAVSKECHLDNSGFAWQSGYYDRIALGPNTIDAVREYIRANPANWAKDKHYVAM